jgi:hypothetical protein
VATPDETLQEVLRGLEGLEMLCQGQISLARDLSDKARRVLEANYAKGLPQASRPRQPT